MKKNATKKTNGLVKQVGKIAGVIDTPGNATLTIETKTQEDIAAEILTILRQEEPEVQNEVMMVVIKELALDRHHKHNAMTQERDRHTRNLDAFIHLTGGMAENAIKEYHSKKG